MRLCALTRAYVHLTLRYLTLTTPGRRYTRAQVHTSIQHVTMTDAAHHIPVSTRNHQQDDR